MPRCLKVIRFDPSDSHVFERAAEPDELAVPGSLLFSSGVLGLAETLKGKQRQAFVNGFLGIGTFGFSTFIAVGEVKDEEIATGREALTSFFHKVCGAPSEDIARDAASQEMDYALELARDTPLNTLLAMRRELDEEGNIREQFSVVKPPAEAPHTRIWDVVEDENE